MSTALAQDITDRSQAFHDEVNALLTRFLTLKQTLITQPQSQHNHLLSSANNAHLLFLQLRRELNELTQTARSTIPTQPDFFHGFLDHACAAANDRL